MKEISVKDIFMILFITLALVICLATRGMQLDSNKEAAALREQVAKLTTQVNYINTSYITTEMLQPALDDLERYEDKVDVIEDLSVEVLKQNEEWSTRWNKYFEPFKRLSEK
jgi:ribosomal protein L11 methylase PrmA